MIFLTTIFRFPSKLRRRARRTRFGTMILLLVTTCLLVAPFYVIYKPPRLLIRYFQYRWPDVLWQINTDAKVIALTIDDAPSQHTREILQVLKDNNATATFFVIGSQVPGREDLLVNILRGGHELGNHAMYDEPSRSLTDAALREQIIDVQSLIEKAYETLGMAEPPRYFRPGSGFFSERMRHHVKQMAHRMVLGGIYPHDAQISWSWVNARHILSMARPGGVVICHDRRSWTAPMLRRVLPRLSERGYRVVSVSEALLEERR